MLRAAIHRVLEIISILTHELCSALWNGWGMCEGMERPLKKSVFANFGPYLVCFLYIFRHKQH